MIIAPERHGSDRIIAFSDAVVAIAITILLLPLADLEMPADGKVTTLFTENAAKFGGLTLSWVIIALFWFGHHRLFDSINIVDRPLMWLDFAWLFAIALMPLPTNIVTENDSTSQVVGFYVGWMALISLLMTLMLWHARRAPGIMDPEVVDSQAGREGWYRSLLITGVFLIVFVIALLMPQGATWFLLLQLAVDPIAARLARR
ncbi:MAG: DUF1211 domain-containing protein [Actinobacteria bacterium]|nr:DUF1211 domain-containing protein [Actinomycetota bacterium]MCB8997094.1 DUF1211 domain-containing protein [Actinomycetota bacterium]MCB9424821.1 DUF1211 domain-containing protein [Actinomycetota bacterium]HRY09429.1 TMEM175 family protein [Candidatus Nanopelagicales bacterium]